MKCAFLPILDMKCARPEERGADFQQTRKGLYRNPESQECTTPQRMNQSDMRHPKQSLYNRPPTELRLAIVLGLQPDSLMNVQLTPLPNPHHRQGPNPHPPSLPQPQAPR